ncbi:hypothetical protein [Polaribacter sp. Asnod1-A03]|uniref:hypothetical protein n=1 Tax=Polaribacter sp. Asnod1-A03 TaxID=3160581 RepID=UPI00386D37C6
MYKRNYHPLVILLYVSGMLDAKQLCKLPKTTKHNWNQFKHENYYGNDWTTDYIAQFEAIKDVFSSKFFSRNKKRISKHAWRISA